ncbi:MAG: fibronectin type III domain-containing protein, partial [Eubacteriales bacterium]|nr:fibronectin type III domain-containing protein [Eubacteriales bacterium]
PFLQYQGALSRKLQEVFYASPWFAQSFALDRVFNMHNGYTIKIYRRIHPYTIGELTYYNEQFAQEREKYPHLYDPVFSALYTAGNTYTRPEWRLAAPQNLRAAASAGSAIQMTWDAVPGSGSYRFYLNGKCIDPCVAGTVYTCTGLNADTVYCFKAAAVSDTGMVGQFSDNIYVKTGHASLGAPQNLHAVETTPDSITIGWDAVPGAAEYHVFVDGILAASVNNTAWALAGLAPNREYAITVAAVGVCGDAGTSSEPLLAAIP